MQKSICTHVRRKVLKSPEVNTVYAWLKVLCHRSFQETRSCCTIRNRSAAEKLLERERERKREKMIPRCIRDEDLMAFRRSDAPVRPGAHRTEGAADQNSSRRIPQSPCLPSPVKSRH